MVKNRYPITIENETVDIGTAAELVVALDVLQGQHDRMVLEQIRPHIAEIINNPQDLYAVLKVLIPEDQLYLIEVLSADLIRIVKTATSLRDIFAMLAENKVEEKILEILGSDGLRTLISSADELSEILEWIYGICDKMALELLGKDFLKRLFQNGSELSLVLHSLDYKSQKDLIEMLGWEFVSSIVKSRQDLAYLLRALPSELSDQLLSNFSKDQLWQIIRDKHGWRYLYKYLEDKEIDYLGKLLGVNNAK